jgi:MraZ protein
MNVPAIPDYISPIVGYRAWWCDSDGLKSLNQEPWIPGKALPARCRTAERGALVGRAQNADAAHELPQTNCTCGVYAWKNPEHLCGLDELTKHLRSMGWRGYGICGEVYLWGTVVEHELGWRAQFAYPKSLVLPSYIDPRLESSRLESLMIYGADISIPPNILVWTKNCGYTQAGLGIIWNCGNSQWEVELSRYTFRGAHRARVDEHGRLEFPAQFIHVIDNRYSTQFYITSLDGEVANVYPIEEWERIEQKLAELSTFNPMKKAFLDRVHYWGQRVEMDGQGRLLIPQLLRESAQFKGEVAVVGKLTYLAVRNLETSCAFGKAA